MNSLAWLMVIWRILRAPWPLLTFIALVYWLTHHTLFDLVGTPLIFPLAFLRALISFVIKAFNKLEERLMQVIERILEVDSEGNTMRRYVKERVTGHGTVHHNRCPASDPLVKHQERFREGSRRESQL